MVLGAGLAALIAACTQVKPGAVESPSPSSPSSATTVGAVESDRRVGAVFLDNQTLHACSGSVLDSEAGDLILTAAHCVADGVDAYFAPGFADDADAADFWRIDAVYLDPRWIADQDPLADFAIARVSRDGGGSVAAQTGGGFALGAAPKEGTEVTVTGYAFGIGGEQLECRARTTVHHGFPSLPCAGLVDGTSGSPWVADSVVTGVVGGFEGGGCDENVSYSPPFDDAIKQLLRRAEAGGSGDEAPTVFADDC